MKQNCAPSWTYLRDYTGLYGQQNVKVGAVVCSSVCRIGQMMP